MLCSGLVLVVVAWFMGASSSTIRSKASSGLFCFGRMEKDLCLCDEEYDNADEKCGKCEVAVTPCSGCFEVSLSVLDNTGKYLFSESELDYV